MNFFRTVFCGFLGVCLGGTALLAGEIGGRILITKSLTKKRVTLPAYHMRSTALPLKNEGKAANEFDRLAIFLEDAGLKKAEPIRTEMIQENLQFLPDFLVVPRGSTVSFR